MWTISYKGYYIHGYCDKPECRINGGDLGSYCSHFKSIHAAKLAITKWINRGK